MLEADGIGKYSDPARFRREKRRDIMLARNDYHTEHLIWDDITKTSDVTAAHLHGVCRSRTARGFAIPGDVSDLPRWPQL